MALFPVISDFVCHVLFFVLSAGEEIIYTFLTLVKYIWPVNVIDRLATPIPFSLICSVVLTIDLHIHALLLALILYLHLLTILWSGVSWRFLITLPSSSTLHSFLIIARCESVHLDVFMNQSNFSNNSNFKWLWYSNFWNLDLI